MGCILAHAPALSLVSLLVSVASIALDGCRALDNGVWIARTRAQYHRRRSRPSRGGRSGLRLLENLVHPGLNSSDLHVKVIGSSESRGS